MFNPINGSQSSSFVDSLKNTKEEKIQTAEEANELSQQDFFTLMTKQLSMQDPMNPTDNEAMMAQMTNMSIAEGVSNMATKFDQFAASMTSNQALQASSLVGRDVLIDTHYVHNTPGEEVSGRILKFVLKTSEEWLLAKFLYRHPRVEISSLNGMGKTPKEIQFLKACTKFVL